MADLDILIPVYNEAETIDELIERVRAAMVESNIDYNIIFIDDRSTDNTVGNIRRNINNSLTLTNGESYENNDTLQNGEIYSETSISNGHSSKINILSKRGEQGKAYSILEGSRVSKAPYIAMIDGDLQYPPEVIPQMYEMAIKSGVVVANRANHEKSMLRNLGSKVNILLFEKILLGFNCDTQSGLKVFNREIIDNLSEKDVTPWTLDMPLLSGAQNLGYKIASIDIEFSERKSGESKVNFFKVGSEIALSALRLKFNSHKTHKIKPRRSDVVAGAGVSHKGKRFITHSHLSDEDSALVTFWGWQKLALWSLLALLVLGLLVNAKATAILLIATLSIIYFIDLLFSLGILLKSLHFPPELKIKKRELDKINEDELPVYTILCPLYKEANMLPKFIEAINKIDWPKDKLEVILLFEQDDQETIDATKELSLDRHIQILVVPHSKPKTKPKACNYGLAHSNGEFVVIYDAEDIPDPQQLKKSYIAFKKLSSDVVCLQSKLNYYNTDQNLITRLFSAEYSLWFDLILPGLQSIGTTIPLGGTSNHFKASALRYLDGWDPFNVTEDCDLGTRLFKAGYKTAIIDSTTYEEANSEVKNWLKQRSRWIKGYMQTYLVHMRDPIDLFSKHGRHALIFQLIIGMRMVFMLINPILWILTIAYFALYNFIGPAIESLYPPLIFYIAVVSLVFGNFIYLYNYMIGCAKRGQWSVIKYIFFAPIYWIMASVSAWMATYQLFVKPHYWEKTVHGLDTKSKLNKKKTIGELVITIDVDSRFDTGSVNKYLSFLKAPFTTVARNFLSLIELLKPLSFGASSPGKMRILMFNWRDTKHVWSGGAEVYIHELAKRLVRDGHSVTVFSGWDGKTSTNEEMDGVQIIRRGGFFTVYLFAALYYLLRFRGKFDIVVDSENGVPFFTPIYIGIPKVLLIHHIHQEVFREHLPFPFSNLAQFLESSVMPSIYRNQSIATVSASSKKDIVDRGWGNEQSVVVINPGVDFSKFAISEKTTHPSFVYLGRLKPYKNIDLAIEAFARVLREVPDAQFTIVGFGESLGSLKKLTKKLAISHAVTFAGRVSDESRADILASAWVALQPSSIEGWGFTVIEANLSGTPVIAANVKGLRDSVVDGVTGILTTPRDIEKLTEAMSGIITNDSLRKELTLQAIEWSKRFDWSVAAGYFEAMLARQINVLKPVSDITEKLQVQVHVNN